MNHEARTRRSWLRRRSQFVALITAVVVLGAAGAAFAVWNANTSASVSGSGATLGEATGFTATTTGGTTANLAWTAPADMTSYMLSQSSGTLAGCSATPTAGTTSCTATGLTAGTTYTWTLKTKFNNWLSSGVQAQASTAAKVVFTTQPVGGVTEGQSLSAQPVVKIEDASNNVVAGDNAQVTLAINSYTAGNGGTTQGTLSCTNAGGLTATASSGVATFSGCQITGTAAAGTYTLVATRSGLTSTGASNNVVINADVANKLVFTQQPVGGVTEGTNFGTQPKVSIEDTNGNVVTSDTAAVALAINSYTAGNGGTTQGTLGCTNTTVNAVAGVASFTNCNITGTAGAGTYTLKATRSGLTQGTSGNVSINAGTATNLVFTQQPVGGVTEGTDFGTQPKVSVEDTNGNVVTSDTGAVALAINTYAAGNGGTTQGTLGCTNTTVNAVAGVATFAGCNITGTAGAGTYTLKATRAGLTQGTSGNVTINAGSIAGIIVSNITTSPTPALTRSGSIGNFAYSSAAEANSSGNVLTAKVSLVDAAGNLVNAVGAETVDLSTSGSGSVVPSGASVLTFTSGSSASANSFTLTRSNGNNMTVVLTATLHGTTQKFTVTLSS